MALIGSRDLRNLSWLDLSRNAVTASGVAMLNACGVPFTAEGQHTALDTDWLREGDWAGDRVPQHSLDIDWARDVLGDTRRRR